MACLVGDVLTVAGSSRIALFNDYVVIYHCISYHKLDPSTRKTAEPHILEVFELQLFLTKKLF